MHGCAKLGAKRRLLIVVLSVGLCEVSLAGLAGRIGKVVEPQEGGEYAIQVVAPASGTVVYNFNARKPLIPASNMKLVTTAAALKYLGSNFEYKTRVGLCGTTLVVIGGGDPLLGDPATDDRHGRAGGWAFEQIVKALRDQGVAEINDIILDSTVFDDQRVHPSWPAKDYNKWYACEVCGLNYNDNCIDVTASNAGGSVRLDIDPVTRFVQITNEVKAVSSGDDAVGAYRSQQPNKITIFGKCRNKQGPFKVAIEQPAAFFGFMLAEQLGHAGITTNGKLVENAFDASRRLKPLVEFTTPISDVLERANTDSLGLAAEALLKTIDAQHHADRKNGSWAGGREQIGKYLAELGVPADEFKIDDGSGLSRENRLSANTITTVLRSLFKSDDWELFRSSLAVGGEEGTIDRYFGEPKYRGKVFGKTGYISGVRSFSGVCLTPAGPYLFSILSNGAKGLSRDQINDIVKAIIDEYQDAK